MKASSFAKLILAAAVCAAVIPAATTFAAADETPKETVYPSGFTHNLESLLVDEINDYAVCGGNVAIATTKMMYCLYDDGVERKCRPYQNDTPITDLDFSENGQMFFKAAGLVYTFDYTTATKNIYEEGYTFPTIGHYFTAEGQPDALYLYKVDESELVYFYEGVETSIGKGYTNIKLYDKKVYALKENKLYEIEESTATAIDLSYTDLSDADNIYSGSTAEVLKSGGYSVRIADVKPNAYVTKIKDGEIGERFEQSGVGATKKSEGVPCVILGESGNASLVCTNDGMFLVATENLVENAYSPKSDSRIGKNMYATEEIGVYSRPYVCGATKIGTLKSGADHPVKVVESFHLDYIAVDFLKVTFTEGEETVTGYVPAALLTEHNFAAEDLTPSEPDESEYSYNTNTVSVIIVLVIVALILIAVLYLAATLNKNARKDRERKKRQSERKKREREPEDDDDFDYDDE